MWQRFTEKARRAVVDAEREANRLRHDQVRATHLFLAILRDEDNGACRVLKALKARRGSILLALDKLLEPGDTEPTTDLHLSSDGKRVIDLAYDESRQLNHQVIGTEHLLLGIIRHGGDETSRVLRPAGVTLETAQREVTRLRDGRPPAPAKRRRIAISKDLRLLAPDLVALMLLADPPAALIDALAEFGQDYRALAGSLEDMIIDANPYTIPSVPPIADFFDTLPSSLAVFGRIANHPATMTHQCLLALGATADEIEAAFGR